MPKQETPKYTVLANWIRSQLDGGKLKCGDKLYSENELSTMFGISRQTVRQAVGLLEQEHIVERKRGSGTFILGATRATHKRTMNIGVISTYLDDYIFPSIIKGIETVLTANGYSMQLAFTHNRVENETRALRTMLEKEVDGIIVEPTQSGLPNPNKALYDEIYRQKLPLLFFNAYYPATPFAHVAIDDTAAGCLATQCLIDAGHQRIAGMFQSDNLQGHLRYAGYLEALRDAGLQSEAEPVLWYATQDMQDIVQEPRRILRRLAGCTGLVCYNDQLAVGMVALLKQNGVQVPQNLSVCSIDNSDLAALCEVPLTSVCHPKELLGETAANNIIRLIADGRFDATVDFAPEVVRRGSIIRHVDLP